MEAHARFLSAERVRGSRPSALSDNLDSECLLWTGSSNLHDLSGLRSGVVAACRCNRTSIVIANVCLR
ncbi:hypothetical protein BQ8482_220051 [Mesorhizobium delmotii]|uniref:Uncharacterized protein n=1 Tax=Mesorhizobium delmotii TaxID=1631247 RepID=A0A2P9AL50_9HYPH|nr:hypothetical protein BQ8482_220051 [Mesorhizobium delmotii]